MTSSLFKGGEPSPGFNQVPKHALYPLNSYNNDPNYDVVASRQTNAFIGGRRHSRRRPRHEKKQEGGAGIVGSIMNGLQNSVMAMSSSANPYAPSSYYYESPYRQYTQENRAMA
jgi:hypothetical protein